MYASSEKTKRMHLIIIWCNRLYKLFYKKK